MADFFRREAKFMVAWLILVPAITAVVGILAAMLLHLRGR
jgi:hypothetical protein